MYIGIDWGGTYIKAGLLDAKGNIRKKKSYASLSFRKKEAFFEAITSLIGSFATAKIKAVGIGAPGIIDSKKGFIYYLPNVPGWHNYQLKRVLQRRLSLPVYVDNDANMFALAEARRGAAKGASRAIFLTIGTGLGGAVIVDGKILEGKTSACEIGHMPVQLNGLLCGCGGRGCIETYVGGRYLLKKYNAFQKRKAPVREVKEIQKRALLGEKEALVIWKDFSCALGMFLSGMINMFNPEKIIFGGGISGAFSLFKPMVKAVIARQAMKPQARGVRLLRSKIKNAGIVGAALYAKDAVSG